MSLAETHPRIAIAAHGRFHAFDLARELHQIGHLAQIATTYPAPVVRRLVASDIVIRSAPALELWRRAAAKSALIPDPDPGLTRAFGRFSARTLPQRADVLVGWSAGILEAIAPAQERGMAVVVERGSTHIEAQAEVLNEEYRSFGLAPPAISRETIEREIAEYQDTNAIVTPSRFAADTFTGRGIEHDKVYVNPLGVDVSQFVPAERPIRKCPKILFVGRVGLRKGVPWLLRGFAPLAGRAALRLVGPIEPGMERILSELPTEAVDVTGPLRGDALLAAFATADIFCLPSIEEGFAQTILEAMASGLPVVATEAAGCGEAIDDGNEGVVVAARDESALTGALGALVEDAERRQAMGSAARDRVVREFGWNRYGARALDIYRRILDAM